jgi:hypothetical protein
MANVNIELGYKPLVWFTANPTIVLLAGQIVYLEQTGTYKIGDGVTQLSLLNFLGISSETQTLQNVTDLGSVTTNNIEANSFVKTGGVSTEFLKANGSVDSSTYSTATKTSDLINDGDDGNPFISLNDLPSNLILYATTAASDIPTYVKLVSSITDPSYNTIAVNVSTGSITTTNQFISALITSPNVIVGNPGVINISTIGNIRRTAGTGNAEFYFEVYKRTIGGVETLITTSGNTIPVINTGYAEFSATALWNDGIFLATDRIVLKFYGSRIVGGSNPTYDFQFGGSTPVRSLVPIPLTVSPVLTLDNLQDVTIASIANNEILTYESSTSLWKNKSVTTALGFTPYDATNPSGYITSSALSTYALIANPTFTTAITTPIVNGVSGNLAFNNVAQTSGAITPFTFTKPNNTTQTASTQINGFIVNGGSRQWATGNITTQSENVWGATTYSFVGASTITNAYGNVFNAPIAGTNCSISVRWAAQFNAGIELNTSDKGLVITATVPSSGVLRQGLSGGYTFSIDGANGSGPRIGLGSTPSSGYDFFEIGAFASSNNFATKNRNFRITSTISSVDDARFVVFSNTGNLTLQNGGTFTDAGFRLDVNGTGRFQNTLTLATGTTSIAPLKLIAGTNLTTPVNGSFEFDGTNLYFTVGGVRKTVTLI